MSSKQFDITLRDAVGEISRVADALSTSNVSIRRASTERRGESIIFHLIAEDDLSTRNALKGAHFEFVESTVPVPGQTSRSGGLAKVTAMLGNHGRYAGSSITPSSSSRDAPNGGGS